MNAAPERPWSLRRRLTRQVVGLVALGWVATIALAVFLLDHEINEMFDEELSALAEATVLFLDASGTGTIAREVGIETSDGERVLRTFALGSTEPPAPWAPLARDGFADSNGWRILRHTSEGTVIEVAHKRSWRREEMLEAATAFLVLILPLLVGLVWALRRGLARGLAPVERLAKAVSGRQPDDLSAMPATGLPTELHPLVDGMNEHIARIEALRHAERRFIGHAAHELRTPIAAVRARLNLSSDPEAQAALPILDALTRRTERLLQLSRAEAGLGLGRGPADLIQVLRLLIDELRHRAKGRIRMDDSDLDRLMVASDPDALAILLRNLLENAIEHGTGDVTIRVSPAAEVTFENPTNRTALLDAPYERRPGSAGSGVGLSIVATLASALGAQVDKRLHDGIATVTVRLTPAA